jgi:hypothetical protein
MNHTFSFRRTTVRILGLTLALTVGGVVGMVAAAPGEEGHQVLLPGVRPLTAIFDSSQPLLIPGKQVASLALGGSAVGYPLYGPQGALPSEVWVSPDVDEAGARVGSSLVLTFALYSTTEEPATVLANEAKDWNLGYTATISGRPAWVIPDHDGNPAPGVACIHVAIGNVEVTMFGKMPIEDLLTEAESLTSV